jgi:hypothetical protein
MMAHASALRDEVRDHVAVGGHPDVLTAIHDDAINLSIWQRQMGVALAKDANALCRFDGEPLRLETALANLEQSLPAALAGGGWQRALHLVADMAQLARQFAAIMGCSAVDLRLEVITGDACRKYHADYVTARLITSYAGLGSQWISDADAAALAGGLPPDRVQPEQLRSGDVALFKGRRWSERPIIHRSPPIAGTGQRRLVLVINPGDPACLS